MSSELTDGFPKIEISPDPPDEETVRRAQLSVCGRARDTEDANLLMNILGIAPNQPEPLSRERRLEEIREARRVRLYRISIKRRHKIPLTEDDEAFVKDRYRTI